MVKVKKPKFPNIEDGMKMVEEKTGVPCVFAEFDKQGVSGMYDIDDQKIYIAYNVNPVMQFQTLVHETAHYIHITVGNNKDATTIDQEIIAFAIEQIIFQKMVVPQAIKYATKKVQKCYNVAFQVPTVTPEDVAVVESQIKDIFGM